VNSSAARLFEQRDQFRDQLGTEVGSLKYRERSIVGDDDRAALYLNFAAGHVGSLRPAVRLTLPTVCPPFR